MTPKEFEAAARMEEEIHKTDPHAFLHKSMIPLRMVTLKPEEDAGLFTGGCSSGTCF